MSDGPQLTDEQQAAVDAADGPYLVVAPPGSGKTEVLVRRVLRLVTESAGEPFRVLALTFTNRAAQELARRAQTTLGDEAWRVSATTLHAFCLDMLQRYGEAVGVVGDTSVLDTDDLRLELLAHALHAAGHPVADVRTADMEDLLSSIDDLRLRLALPDDAPSTPALGDPDGITLSEAYRGYEVALDDARSLDFPGMLYRAWRLLTEDPWVGSHYRRQYRHLLVDEAQDLTYTQAEILRAFCGSEVRNVFLVADDDQEIFSFAGASSEYYADLAKELGATPLHLSTNFRSAQRIVQAAERLREHFTTIRVQRPPAVPATPAQGWIGLQEFQDPEAEAEGVALWVDHVLQAGLDSDWLHLGEDSTLRPDDVCVMARTRYGFDPLVRALESADIAYVLRTEEAGLFDSSPGRAVYYGLRLLANPHDHASRRRLESELQPALLAGMASDTSGEYQPTAATPDPVVSSAALVAHGGLPPELVDLLPAGDPPPASLIDAWRDVMTTNGMDADLWESDRRRLADDWEVYAARTRKTERALADFLRQISRLERTPPDLPGVRLMTPYRAKGLQFRAVAITGMAIGLFPHYRAATEREIDEERRAVYVAVTRASRAVLLTRSRKRQDRYGRVHRDAPSPFLAELGLDPTG